MNTKVTRYIMTALLCLLTGTASAQRARITGVVTSNDGPVMMCNVIEVDVNNRNVSHTQTDINGNFALDVKNVKNKLKVSYVGYKTYTTAIGSKRQFSIKLVDATQIQDVVVTGNRNFNHGGLEIPENQVTVAAQTFDMSEVEGLAFTSVDEALQGQIAGLDVVYNSGNLGAGTTMRLRGITSITGSSEPLIVVDDNIFENPDENFDFENGNEETYAALLSVNPEDIASIDVLKDAAATAIWGAKGANGVISIKTKRGARGKIRVNYSLRLQTSWQPTGYNLLNGDDYTMLMKEQYYNPSQNANATLNINELNYNRSWSEFENWNNNTDWQSKVSQVGVSQYHSVTISGGGEKAHFRVSAGYDHQNGTIIKQTLDRFTTRLALDYFVSDRIKFSTTFPLTYTKNIKNTAGLLGIAQRLAPNMSVYRQDGDGNDTDEYYIMLPPGANNDVGSSVPGTSAPQLSSIRNLGNPIAIANESWGNESTYRISPNFRITYQLLGTHEDQTRLKYEAQVNMDIYSNSTRTYKAGSMKTSGWTDGDYNSINNSESASLNFSTRHTFTLTPHFRNKDWYSTMNARWEISYNQRTSQNVSAKNLPNEIYSPTLGVYHSAGSGTGEGRDMNYSWSGHLAYKDRYSLGASIRADGRTSFGDKNKWGYFPGISARWNFYDEPFMKWWRSVVSMMSIRVSWGLGGNSPSNSALYPSYKNDGAYGSGTQNQSVTYMTGLQLNKAKWETTQTWNFGSDIGFWHNRIKADANLYYRHTYDLLNSGLRIPSTTGFTSVASANVGEMTNKGWELHISLNDIIKAGKFRANVNFNFAQNFNRILEMDENVLKGYNKDWDSGSRGTYLKRIQVGNPLGSIYGLRSLGVYQFGYEWLTDQRDMNGWDTEQFRDFINNFLAGTLPDEWYTANGITKRPATAPVATDEYGHVLMERNGNPKRMVYNYRDGASTYQFAGGDAIYEDINHDGQINALDIVYLGNSNPKIQGGFGVNLRYGNWSMRANFSYRIKYSVVNKARMNLEKMYDAYNESSAVNWRWRKNGEYTEIPRALYNTGYNWLGSDRYVETLSFLRMSYTTLSYDVPKKSLKSIGLNQLHFQLSMQNPFVWSHYSGQDPEHGAGAYGIAEDNSQTPRGKSVTLNINIGF